MGRRKIRTKRRSLVPKPACAYCGREATETDHVPPQGLFTEREKRLLIEVPSCHSCNNRASKDEEYLIWALTVNVKATGPMAKAAQARRLERPSTPRRLRMAARIVRTSSLQPVYTAEGLYLGTLHTFDPDVPRVNRALEKVVRAVYFRETGSRVPANHGVRAIFDPQLSQLHMPTIQAALATPPRVVVEDGFEYWFGPAANAPTAAVVVLLFFRGVTGLGIIVPPDWQPTRD